MRAFVCTTVWGFNNLFVGRNGVIPMNTNSNHTLTSVAMAVTVAKKVIEKLQLNKLLMPQLI